MRDCKKTDDTPSPACHAIGVVGNVTIGSQQACVQRAKGSGSQGNCHRTAGGLIVSFRKKK